MKSIINGSSLRWALMSTPSSTFPFPHSFKTNLTPCFNPISLPLPRRHLTLTLTVTAFAGKTSSSSSSSSQSKPVKQEKEVEEVQVEEEEELPWIQEKALDLVEFTGSVTQVIPGPRVPHTSLPWLIAPPLAFVGLTFVFAFLKTLFTTLSNFNSPRHKRRLLVNKNAMLIKSIDDLFALAPHHLQHSSLQQLINKTGFSMEEILRKYIRYALNEKPFDANLVSDLILLRKASMLTDSQVAECLNEISRRIVKDKGPVVMDTSGYTEKGFNRKLAVQALFGKVFYLSELPELCSRDSSLIVKEIFGVTDEDADQLRIHTLSNIGDMEALEKMAEDGSDLQDSNTS